MKFAYKTLAPGREAPIITIKIRNPRTGKEVACSALVDSGADRNYFHPIAARLIGLELEKGTREGVQGIGGSASAYRHNVELVVSGWVFPTTVGFVKDFGGYAQGVVGQVGFFDQFKFVKFDKRHGSIEIGDLVMRG